MSQQVVSHPDLNYMALMGAGTEFPIYRCVNVTGLCLVSRTLSMSLCVVGAEEDESQQCWLARSSTALQHTIRLVQNICLFCSIQSGLSSCMFVCQQSLALLHRPVTVVTSTRRWLTIHNLEECVLLSIYLSI
jgi:hypothetical protein